MSYVRSGLRGAVGVATLDPAVYPSPCPFNQVQQPDGSCVNSWNAATGECKPGQVQQPDGSCADPFSVITGGCGAGQVQQPDGSCVTPGGGQVQPFKPKPPEPKPPEPTPAIVEPPTQASMLDKASPWIIAGVIGLVAVAFIASPKSSYKSNRRRARRSAS